MYQIVTKKQLYVVRNEACAEFNSVCGGEILLKIMNMYATKEKTGSFLKAYFAYSKKSIEM